MVKNMKNEMKNENRDNVAAIGIGAMIVFIAPFWSQMAAAVIIQTAEKRSKTHRPRVSKPDLMAGRITVLSVVIVTGADLYVTFELAPGSDALVPSDVEFQIICPGGNSAF